MVNISGPIFSWVDRILLTYGLYMMVHTYPWTIALLVAYIGYIHYKYYGKENTIALIPSYILYAATVAIGYISAQRSWAMIRLLRSGNSAAIMKEPYKNGLSVIGLGASAYFLL